MYADALQRVGGHDVNSEKEVVEKRDIVVLQLLKIGIMDIGSKKGVRHIMTHRAHQVDELLDGPQEVECNKTDTVVLPEDLRRRAS